MGRRELITVIPNIIQYQLNSEAEKKFHLDNTKLYSASLITNNIRVS